MKLLAFALVALAPIVASGDETGAVVTLDRTVDRTYLGVDAGLQSSDWFGIPVLGLRLDLHGQVAARGLVLQGSLPMAYVTFPWSDGSRQTVLVQGNARLDASHTRRWGDLRLTLRAGLTLPTGESDPLWKPLLWPTAYQRLTDLTGVMSGTWLRGGVTARYRRGPGFAQIDVSAETGFDTDEMDLAFLLYDWGGSFLLHANAAVGFERNGISLAAELATVRMVHAGEPGGSLALRSFAVTGQLPLGEWRPTLSLVVPWREGSGVLAYALNVGLRRAF